jgi:hypothetical protein
MKQRQRPLRLRQNSGRAFVLIEKMLMVVLAQQRHCRNVTVTKSYNAPFLKPDRRIPSNLLERSPNAAHGPPAPSTRRAWRLQNGANAAPGSGAGCAGPGLSRVLDSYSLSPLANRALRPRYSPPLRMMMTRQLPKAIAGRLTHDHWMNSPSPRRIQSTIRL